MKRERWSGVALIMGVSVGLSLLFWMLASSNSSWVPCFALQARALQRSSHLWTIFTHFFVHVGLLHLFLNMYVLSSLGPPCERILGRRTFLRFYIFSGSSAGLLSVLASTWYGTGWGARVLAGPEVYLLGASGAIFAIAGFFVVALPRVRFSIVFLPFISLPGYIMVPLVLVLTWILSIVGDFPIGNVAHTGGFLVGVLFGWYGRAAYRGRLMWLQSLARRR